MSEEVVEKPGGLVKRWMERVQSWIDEAGDFVEGTVFWRVWERMLENEFIDRSLQAGTSRDLASDGFIVRHPFRHDDDFRLRGCPCEFFDLP